MHKDYEQSWPSFWFLYSLPLGIECNATRKPVWQFVARIILNCNKFFLNQWVELTPDDTLFFFRLFGAMRPMTAIQLNFMLAGRPFVSCALPTHCALSNALGIINSYHPLQANKLVIYSLPKFSISPFEDWKPSVHSKNGFQHSSCNSRNPRYLSSTCMLFKSIFLWSSFSQFDSSL